MMFKLIYISLVLLVINSNVFGQTSSASASATIVTPVGAELSGDINNADLFSKNQGTSSSSNNNDIENKKQVSFLKIIGDTFAHQVTVENDIILTREGVTRTAHKDESLVGITVNFD